MPQAGPSLFYPFCDSAVVHLSKKSQKASQFEQFFEKYPEITVYRWCMNRKAVVHGGVGGAC